MTESLLRDGQVKRAVSNIQPRSERQLDLSVLERTYVDTGVLPQLQNGNNQILYGRRGTGKSHVFRILGAANDRSVDGGRHIYVDVRLLGSAQLMTDSSQPLTIRCVSVFRDLLSEIQNHLLELATDPTRDGGGLEQVSDLADSLTRVARSVKERTVTLSTTQEQGSDAHLSASVGTSGAGVSAGFGSHDNEGDQRTETFTEVYRDTVVFSEVAGKLNSALEALGIERFLVLIDEWTAIPVELQPYVAEFIKRSLLTSSRITIKIASLEYRSRFSLERGPNTLIGFELGPDVAANLDLDDYYVYERNPEQVTASFLELLFQHLRAELPDNYLEDAYEIRTAVNLRTRLFTEPATFVELVRAGEGVVRDFLGIFSLACFRALRQDSTKCDMNSVEEAARDWYETDKAANLAPEQERVLHKIIGEVIGERQARSFLVERSLASHPMIQSLFDLRLLHLLRRGYSDKENPGLRYNIYTLDYGTYVDLKRTKRQPELDLIPLEQIGSDDRIVPFDDKRSIRRIILGSGVLEPQPAG